MARYLKQSTAATVVLGPFVDDTDGKTAETGLTIAAADVRLSKNGGAFGAANAAASHMENGYYSNVLSTGNTDTLGRLTITVAESGALPVRLDYIVLDANTYDAIVGGTDKLQVDVVQWEGADASTTAADWEAEAGPTAQDIWEYATRTVDLSDVTDVLGTPTDTDIATDIANLPTAADNATTLLATALSAAARADGAAPTLQQALAELMVGLGLTKIERSGTTLTGYAFDETTVYKTWTLDSATAPTSRTSAS